MTRCIVLCTLLSCAEASDGGDDFVALDVPSIAWGTDRETTYIGALEAALSVTDRARSYDELMAVSGLAFRTRWWRGAEDFAQSFCKSSPVGEFEQEMRLVDRALGLRQKVDIRFDRPAGQYGFQDRMDQLRASIDEGIPVLCYSQNTNMAVVSGYSPQADRILLETYDSDHPQSRSITEIGAMMVFIDLNGRPVTPLDWLQQALSTAIANYERNGYDSHKPGRYYLGSAALQRWRSDLLEWSSLTPAQQQEMFHPHWWTFDSLYDARLSAQRFLQTAADTFPEHAAALRAIADIYAQETTFLARSFQQKDVFLGPWTGKQSVDWSDDVRTMEGDILQQIDLLDGQAIARMKHLLSIL